ncbi:MAG: iron-containing alcohol dehydrogenase [Clostridia bacterium]|nr:iron-containing alcohol dehydrogenase [Clostridia bacterium]
MKIEYNKSQLILPQVTCSCAHHQAIDCDIHIGSHIINEMNQLIMKKIKGTRCMLITDKNLFMLFGEKIVDILKKDFNVSICVPNEQDPLRPDQYAIGEVMMSLSNDIEFLIAFGSGTINDITRYVAHHCCLPFASIGTAPSMDGYLSVVAPMLKDDLKINKPAKYPSVCIFDTEILKTAPSDMVFAGFGDVIGKYIAKADWILSHHINDESVCPFCLELDDMAITLCEENIDNIKEKNSAGIKAVLEALLLTGLAMLLNGDSRPAASNEHNMGHFIEMKKLQAKLPHPSHGEAVGISTLYCLDLYQKILSYDFSHFNADDILSKRDTKQIREQKILRAYGEEVGNAVLQGNIEELITAQEHLKRLETFFRKRALINKDLAFLPQKEDIIHLFSFLDGPVKASDIMVGDDLLKQALLYAKDYRSRYNVFKLADELGILEELIDDMVLHELK